MTHQPDTTILHEQEGISSSQLTNMPMYSKTNGVTTGRGNISGKVYLKIVDTWGPSGEGREETKCLVEEVYNSEDGDIILVGYSGLKRNLAMEALDAAYRYIDEKIMPEGQRIDRNVCSEWERDTIRRLMDLVGEEIETNNNIPRYIREKFLYQ